MKGRPVAELYRHETTPGTYTHVWSVTKSVVSTLVGIAIADGKIDDLDQTVAELLPQHRRQISAALARVTLRQLLTMSSGLTDQTYVEQTSASDDSLPTILGLPLDTEGIFSYSNVGSHLVAAIVAERVGMPLLGYARSACSRRWGSRRPRRTPVTRPPCSRREPSWTPTLPGQRRPTVSSTDAACSS